MDCGSAWNSLHELESTSNVALEARSVPSRSLTNHHDLISDWLLPQHCHLSPGSSSTGKSLIESSPSECGLLAPSFTISSFGFDDGSNTQFSSPSQQFLALEGEAWDSATTLDFDFPLITSLPVSGNLDNSMRSGLTQHQRQKPSRSTAPITFSEQEMNDAHLAFFSQDLTFAPVGAMYHDGTKDTCQDNIDPELEAFLQDMSKGPAHIETSTLVSPILETNSPPSLPTPTCSTSPKSSSPAPAKVTKEFHFVANSDKAGAARVRNTMASRKHRQSKVNRIAELEKLLAEAEEERDMWKQRALEKGVKN